MKRKNLYQLFYLASLTATATALVGCARNPKAQAPDKPKELVIMSGRGVVPPPYAAPEFAQRSAKPAASTMPAVVVNDSTAQPALPVPAAAGNEAIFVADNSAITTPQPMAVDVATPENLSPKTPAPEKKPAPPKRSYTVQKGDSLSIIAYMYKVPWRDLAAANNLTEKSILKVGQKLTLPAGAAETPRNRPVIKKAAAKKPAAAKAAATAKPATAAAAKPATAAAAKPAKKGAPIPADGFYTIVKGDNLWLIAHRFQLKSADIKALNPDVNFDRLQINTRIRLTDGTKPASAIVPVAPKTPGVEDVPALPGVDAPADPAALPAVAPALPASIPSLPATPAEPQNPGLPQELPTLPPATPAAAPAAPAANQPPQLPQLP